MLVGWIATLVALVGLAVASDDSTAASQDTAAASDDITAASEDTTEASGDTTAAASASVPDDFDASEVLIVWGDRFRRWRGTRWFVAAEMVYPVVLTFASRDNLDFRSVAFQLRAVMACEPDFERRRRMEVECRIEDVGLRAMSIESGDPERRRDVVQQVLDEIDASLTGATVQLHTNHHGMITNVDVDGMRENNLRERQRAEVIRQVLLRAITPFHMKLPRTIASGTQWVEYNSQLMTAPSAVGTKGSSTLVHYLNAYQGRLLVQDIGRGLVEVETPETPVQVGGRSADARDITSHGSEDNARNLPGPIIPAFSGVLAYKLHMDGLAVYDPDTGIMEERVWSVKGKPIAQNPGVMPLWYSGRIQLLGSEDRPDVGFTGEVAFPGMEVDGVPRWMPVDPVIAEAMEGLPERGGG